MKKYLMMALAAMILAGCSKDDGMNIDKTYANDDFTMTERNIKEKLVGTWTIDEVKYSNYGSWVNKSSADLGSAAQLKAKADGSGELLGLENVKWRVSKDTIVVSCNWVCCTLSDGASQSFLPIGTMWPYSMTRDQAMSDAKKNFGNETKITTESREYLRGRIIKMDKDYFDIRYIKSKYPWANGETTCKLYRK